MIVSIHQPNYIPWIGYFDKMDRCDKFVILDDVRHSKSSVTHRNRILNNGEPKYLSVPLINKEDIINRLQINNNQNELQKHWKIIKQNYSKALCWDYISEELESIYSKNWIYLVDLNIEIINLIKKKLQIDTELIVSSNNHFTERNGSDRNLDICLSLSAKTYLSGNGAKKYNKELEFEKNGVEIIYQDFIHPEYRQFGESFVEKMSVLDLLFHHGEKSIEIIRSARL